MRNMGILMINPDSLVEALKLPADTNIFCVEWAFDHNRIRIYIEHPDLDEVHEGNILPLLTPLWHIDCENDNIKFISW